MSETTTSTPAEAPVEDRGPVSPAPDKGEALSVSEAARLLGKQRAAARAQQGEARLNPSQQGQPPPEAKPEDAPKAKPSVLDKAFGVPGKPAAAAGADGAAADDAGPTVEVDGQRYTRQQLKDAIDRSADYTKKTQTLAEQMRAVQEQQAALQQVLPYIQPELMKLQQLVNGVQRPDPGMLETDPKRYFHELANWERAREEQGRIFGVNQYQSAATQKEFEQKVEAANQTLAKEFPFWANAEERGQAQAEIVAWATEKGGFTKDELRHLSDARVLKTLMKAAMYDRLANGTRTMAPQGRAPVRGQAPPPAPTGRISAAQQAFEDKPSVRTGAALLGARRAQ